MDPYPGLPTPRIGAHLDHAGSRANYDGEEFFLGKVDMPANIGTYLDSPFHRFAERDDLAKLALERLLGLEGFIVDARQEEGRALTPVLPDGDLGGSAILIRTGWASRWGSKSYWEPGPFLTDGFAEQVADRGVSLVGVDCWNVDDTTTRRRPVHTRLLDAGILIVEHLCNLDRVPVRGFRFFAPVLAIEGGASFPVRAFAEVVG